MTSETLIRVAEILRETHPDVRKIFNEGGCFEFYRALHAINPALEPYYDGIYGHVYGRLGNTFFDISGAHAFGVVGKHIRPLTEEPRLLLEARSMRSEAWK